MAMQKYSVNQEKNALTMSVSMKNQMKNDRQNVSQKAAAQVTRAAYELFKAGKKAEVAFDDERPHEVWFPATVLKHSHKGTFQVEYQQPGSGDEAVLHKATVNFWHIRPSPPHLRDTDFGLDDEVDAYYDYGWWCGVITQKLPGNRYSVFFEHSNKEREFICSKLRPHIEWEDGKWHNEGDTIFQ
nr:hypothetical protein [Tanacetum cinerariifolium]